jgi:hypothetical protein
MRNGAQPIISSLVGNESSRENSHMKLESKAAAGSMLCLVLGWVLSAIPILMMGVGGER